MRALSDAGRVWRVTKLVNKTTTDKACDALTQFATKICMSELLNQIILTPPICNHERICKLAETHVAAPPQAAVPNNLNPSQKEALQYASTRALTLI